MSADIGFSCLQKFCHDCGKITVDKIKQEEGGRLVHVCKECDEHPRDLLKED